MERTLQENSSDHDVLDSSLVSNVISNFINIANGMVDSCTSPEEEVIRARGRKTSCKVERVKFEELSLVLATKKSPCKPSNVDFWQLIRSPTPKKKPVITLNSEFSHLKMRASIRKRLNLNSPFYSIKSNQKDPSLVSREKLDFQDKNNKSKHCEDSVPLSLIESKILAYDKSL